MPLTVADILNRIESGVEIQTIAPVMRRLLMLKEEHDDSAPLLELISNDPALAVRLLRAANSSGEYDRPVTTIKSAYERLGFQTARSIALTAQFLDDQTQASETDPSFRLQWLWERSLCTAIAAQTFAEHAGLSEIEQYRTLGLLLDIGVFFLMNSLPDQYIPILDRWRIEGGDLVEIEEQVLGVNHLVVGHQLARSWSLGPLFEEGLNVHALPSADNVGLVNRDVLELANVSTAVLFEDRHVTGLERAVRFAAKKFKFERTNYIDILQRVTLLADASAVKMTLEAGPSIPYVSILKSINQELGRAALSYEQMVRELEISMHKAETLALKLEDANRKLKEAANVDPLTKVYNRRFFEEFLAWNFNRSQRYNTTLGCMMIDIDHFKDVNDTYGHLIGDHVLQGVAEALRANLRNTDIVARYGGEEFIVLLPETRPEAVPLTAEKLNREVGKRIYNFKDVELRVTISVGYVAFTPSELPDITSSIDLIRTADQNMYKAKLNGRDRVWPEFHSSENTATSTN